MAAALLHAGLRTKTVLMHAPQAIQQQSFKPNPSTLPDFGSSFAEQKSRAAAVYSDEVPLLTARLSAMRDADKFCFLTKVYRSDTSFGWAYTNSLAPPLRDAEPWYTAASAAEDLVFGLQVALLMAVFIVKQPEAVQATEKSC